MSAWRPYDGHIIPAFYERFEKRWGERDGPPFLDPEVHEQPMPRAQWINRTPGGLPSPWSPSGLTTPPSTAPLASSTCRRPGGIFGCSAQGQRRSWNRAGK